MNNRILKAFAPLVLASLLLQPTAVFAISGGPFDGGRAPGATAAGTYSGIMTGRNLIGMTQFAISTNTESNGRFVVFHEGIMSYGVAQGFADPSSQRIAGALMGLALVPGENDASDVNVDDPNAGLTQDITLRGSAEGAWTAEMKGFPIAITFEGKGQISTIANPTTVTEGTAAGTVTVTGAGTADGVGGDDPQIVQTDANATVFSTTLRATTPFEIRGSRTSLTGYTPINSFNGIDPVIPSNP